MREILNPNCNRAIRNRVVHLALGLILCGGFSQSEAHTWSNEARAQMQVGLTIVGGCTTTFAATQMQTQPQVSCQAQEPSRKDLQVDLNPDPSQEQASPKVGQVWVITF